MKKTLTLPRAALGCVMGLLLSAGNLAACDACNIAFGKQLENKRADSLLARDFRAAVHNQDHLLKGSGLGSEAFQPVIPRSPTDPTGADRKPVVLGRLGPLASAAPQALALTTDEPSPVAGEAQTATPPASAAAPAPAGPASAAGLLRFGGSYGKPYDQVPDAWKKDQFIEIIERDYSYPFPATSFVPQETKPDKSFTIELSEGKTYIGNGVIYDGFLTNGKVPGPLLVVDEGDIVEFIVKNSGTVPHGASVHSAYTQTSKYLGKINPGQSGRVVFRATIPGVYMYHCAPGGHAIPMHVLFGQYGMMVVKPKRDQYELEKTTGKKPDIEIYMVQHEFYANGKDAVENKALYTMFNGKLFRYVEEPIKARPGDHVRIYFLNVGPNLISTFHIVGIIWDFAYWQGNPAMAFPGGQSVLAGPTDSWVIDFRVPPDEGAYTILNHAVGAASRGAIGLLVAEKDAERTALVTPETPDISPEELAEMEKKAVRTISPFKPTPFDKPQRYAPGTRQVDVEIIGNSYWPKVIEIEPGTTVTWTNEDTFTYLAGEFAGIHNAAGDDGGDEFFATPLLAHGESGSYTFEKEGTYHYTCHPHPYMKGTVVVKKPEGQPADAAATAEGGGKVAAPGYLLPLVFGAFLVSLISLFVRSRTKETA